jgi:type II secretory pathway component PulK
MTELALFLALTVALVALALILDERDEVRDARNRNQARRRGWWE